MRDQGNHDLRTLTEPNHGRREDRRQQQAVKSGSASLAAGYTTIDQAETGPFSMREREGLGTPANRCRRY
jgi:hypothetical protein